MRKSGPPTPTKRSKIESQIHLNTSINNHVSQIIVLNNTVIRKAFILKLFILLLPPVSEKALFLYRFIKYIRAYIYFSPLFVFLFLSYSLQLQLIFCHLCPIFWPQHTCNHFWGSRAEQEKKNKQIYNNKRQLLGFSMSLNLPKIPTNSSMKTPEIITSQNNIAFKGKYRLQM